MLDTDASNVGIGVVLSQVHQGYERVIAYFSQALSKPVRNDCTIRHELLLIVKAIDHFHPYLYGRKLTTISPEATKLQGPRGSHCKMAGQAADV